jgi:nucleoid DNA-binding protein
MNEEFDRTDLIARVHLDTGLSADDAAKAVRSVFKNLNQALVDHRRVEIAGFGSLYVAPRKGRPYWLLGNLFNKGARITVEFNAAKALRDALERAGGLPVVP